MAYRNFDVGDVYVGAAVVVVLEAGVGAEYFGNHLCDGRFFGFASRRGQGLYVYVDGVHLRFVSIFTASREGVDNRADRVGRGARPVDVGRGAHHYAAARYCKHLHGRGAGINALYNHALEVAGTEYAGIGLRTAQVEAYALAAVSDGLVDIVGTCCTKENSSAVARVRNIEPTLFGRIDNCIGIDIETYRAYVDALIYRVVGLEPRVGVSARHSIVAFLWHERQTRANKI